MFAGMFISFWGAVATNRRSGLSIYQLFVYLFIWVLACSDPWWYLFFDQLLLCCPLKMSVILYASVIIHPACFTVRSNHVLLMKVKKKKKSKKWKELAEFLGMADFIVTSCALDSCADCHCRSLLWSVSIESVVKWGSRNRNPPGHWGSPWCYRDLCFFLWMCILRRGSALASEDGNVHSKIARPLL